MDVIKTERELLEEQLEKELEEALRIRAQKIELLRSRIERLSKGDFVSGEFRIPESTSEVQNPERHASVEKPTVTLAILTEMHLQASKKWSRSELVQTLSGRVDSGTSDIDALIGSTLQRLKNVGHVTVHKQARGRVRYSISPQGQDYIQKKNSGRT